MPLFFLTFLLSTSFFTQKNQLSSYPPGEIACYAAEKQGSELRIRASGPAGAFGSLVEVSLFGPNEKKEYIGSKTFDARQEVSFTHLRGGRYWLKTRVLSSEKIRITPRKPKLFLTSEAQVSLELWLE